ncbi:MAG: hypothetical protein HC901_02240 [Bdellovibrionaceae bacterium]|nr:hypothetical protein [Pseudobdellovibrionaceae bacterium]
MTKTEAKPAWELFANDLPGGQFALGEHMLAITPYDTGDVAGTPLILWISVINSTAPQNYAEWIGGFPSLTGNDALPDAHPYKSRLSNLENYAFGAFPLIRPTTARSCR